MADIGLRYYRKNMLNTDWYPVEEKVAARKAYNNLLDEFNHNLITDFLVLCPDGKVIRVKKTVETTFAVMVRFCKGGKLYPYESDEEIPVGQTILVEGGDRLQILPVAECRNVTRSELKTLADGHKVKRVIAICVNSMKNVRKAV